MSKMTLDLNNFSNFSKTRKKKSKKEEKELKRFLSKKEKDQLY